MFDILTSLEGRPYRIGPARGSLPGEESILDDAIATVEDLVAEGAIPSASLAVVRDGREVLHHTAGHARLDPPRPAAEDQPYDLASLTKALAATPVVASLMDEGRLSPGTRVADRLADVDPRITLAHLLVHASGYPPWRPLYEEAYDAWGLAETRRHLLRLARTTPLEHEPGTRHAYSDLGFLVLLELLEAVGEAPFDVLFRERVAEPAGAEDLRWGWPRAAATEDCPVRGHVVEGTVHDLNCAALGGVSTHAGLFGPARAVADLADRLRAAAAGEPRGRHLPGEGLRTLWSLRGPGTHVGGWDTPTRDGYTSTGRFFPDDAVGHLGYTGTSLWIVPSRRAVVVLLTNRVHPRDDLAAIRAARPRIHDAVARGLGWDTP